jgi:hypothetical protein
MSIAAGMHVEFRPESCGWALGTRKVRSRVRELVTSGTTRRVRHDKYVMQSKVNLLVVTVPLADTAGIAQTVFHHH